MVPREFLRQRSRVFQTQIDRHPSSLTLRKIKPSVFRRFLLWAVSPQPSIDPQTTLEEWKELALVAEEYEVIALRNQLADWFNERIVSGDWVLQPEILPEVYERCGADSPLLKVCRAALMSVSRERHESEEDRWKKLVRQGGDLAIDVYQAGLQAQTEYGFGVSHMAGAENVDPCRFHRHSHHGVRDGTEGATSVDDDVKLTCPYHAVECFPDDIAKEGHDDAPSPPTVDETGPEPADEFAACDASLAELAEEEALPTEDIPGQYDEPEAVPVAICDEPAEPAPETEGCVDCWAAAPKKFKKDKKKKRKSTFDEEGPVEEAPVDEQLNGWERLG